MDYKKFLVTAGLILTTLPSKYSENTTYQSTQIYESFCNTKEKTEDKPVYYKFELSKELLEQIDSVDFNKEGNNVICRPLEELQNTPLFMKRTKRHIGEFLGYNQYEDIINKYNPKDSLDQDSLPKTKIQEYKNLSFPLIYEELDTIIPKTLTELITEDKFEEYRDTLTKNQTAIIVMKKNDGKNILAYYVNNELFLATHSSIGRGRATTRGIFDVKEKIFDKKSTKYRFAPMPYSLHITGNIFIHQGYVDGQPRSHGCIRIPGLYAEVLFYHTKIGTIVVVVD